MPEDPKVLDPSEVAEILKRAERANRETHPPLSENVIAYDLPALCRSHEKLREIIRAAPHGGLCGVVGRYDGLRCDCWKAAAEGGKP